MRRRPLLGPRDRIEGQLETPDKHDNVSLRPKGCHSWGSQEVPWLTGETAHSKADQRRFDSFPDKASSSSLLASYSVVSLLV
jgi:hypothetical protein